jgi:hypothetical protein
MENLMLWIVVVLATITVYRLLSRRVVTPKARVTEMLRGYRALERTGLSEHECLLQLLATRRNWKGLPHRFLGELVSRLRSKEDVIRFVSVSEDYGYHREDYPGCKRKDVIERRSSCRNWRYAYNPISILPIFPWRLPITKRGGIMMHFHYSNKASLDSKTSKTIPT